MTTSQLQWPFRLMITLTFVLASLVDSPAQTLSYSRFGLTVNPLTQAILRDLGLPLNTTGVVVADVQLNSVAKEAGVRQGDIIQEVNRKRIANITEYQKVMKDVNTMVMFLINRKGEHRSFALEGPLESAR